jgi:DNA-binding CsgD family transcriptional regulator
VVNEIIRQRASTRPRDRLTAREYEVLELMAQGLANATIAERLFVSERAVSKHIGGIFDKLNPPAEGTSVHRRVPAVLHVEGEARALHSGVDPSSTACENTDVSTAPTKNTGSGGTYHAPLAFRESRSSS